MNRPIRPLQEQLFGRPSGGLRSIQRHIAYLDKLTRLVRTVLPPESAVQVASFEHGILCLVVEHHATASQLRYVQLQYIEKLTCMPEFAGIHRLKVIVEVQPKPRVVQHERLPSLSHQTKQVLNEAATIFDDPELSEAFRRLASKK